MHEEAPERSRLLETVESHAGGKGQPDDMFAAPQGLAHDRLTRRDALRFSALLPALPAAACALARDEVPPQPGIPAGWACRNGSGEVSGRRFDSFLPRGFDRQRGDASPFLRAAAEWSAHNAQPVIVEGDLVLVNPLVLDAENSHLHFDCARIAARDDGRRLRTRYGRKIPIAIYVLADKVSLTGDCLLSGKGVPGKTFLNGLYGEEVADLTLGRFTLSNMALGLHFMCCTRVICDDTRAISMWGLQATHDGGHAGAGSAQIVSGCTDSRFGRLTSLDNDKAARYLSVGKRRKEAIDNRGNVYGKAFVTGRPGSQWVQVMGARSSVDSQFEGGMGRRVSFLLNIEQYVTDEAYHIEGNSFGDWSGSLIDAPASSVDAGINILIEKGVKPLGRNSIGSIDARMPPTSIGLLQQLGLRAPQNFGFWCNSGEWTIASLATTGFVYGIHAENCDLSIGEVRVARPECGILRYGRGVSIDVARLDIATDVAGPRDASSLINDLDIGTGNKVPSVRIEQVRIAPEKLERTGAIVDERYYRNSVQIGKVEGGAIPVRAE